MIKRKIMILLVVPALMLCACHSKKNTIKNPVKTVVATLQSSVKHLYFSGTIQPIKTVAVLSPVEGTIEKLNFVYGQNVKKGQLIATINSVKLMDDFRQAVGDYLSKKSSYLNQERSFEGSKALFKAGVIDAEDYKNEQSQYENSILSFYQQEYALKKVLLKAGVNPRVIESLKITDVDKIKKLYASKLNHIKIPATTSGVALFPLPSQNQAGVGATDDADSSSGTLMAGSSIHEGQLVLSIGNLSGFSIDMSVNEVSVNELHKGLSAVVTGAAFPDLSLKGVVSYVASQAQPNQNTSSSSLFKVSVRVPSVTKAQLHSIHVGMTAKIDIAIQSRPQVMLPINAVYKKSGMSFVTLEKNGHKHEVPVMTGATTPTEVVIIKGVSPGAVVQVPTGS